MALKFTHNRLAIILLLVISILLVLTIHIDSQDFTILIFRLGSIHLPWKTEEKDAFSSMMEQKLKQPILTISSAQPL